MTGNKIYHVFNGKKTLNWVDELEWRGDSKKSARRKKYARLAKRRELVAVRKEINKELADY